MRLQNMHGKSTAVFVVIAGVLALGAGIGLSIYLDQSSTSTQTTTIKSTSLIGKQRPDFSMGDVEGEKRSISEFDGKVLIVLIALQEKYEDKGFTIVGVALDSQQAAIDFVDPMGINYPILVGETDGIAISQAYGNELTVLPYTVVIDRKGIIRHAFAREITLSEAEELIKPFL